MIDAYYWLKTPGESDGCTQELPDGTACPRFDRMCGSSDSIGSASGEPRSPEAGHWFDYQVKQLAANAQLSPGPAPPAPPAPTPTPTPTPPAPTPTPPAPTPTPTPPAPTPTPPAPTPTPTPTPGDCPGGSLSACIDLCPADVF